MSWSPDPSTRGGRMPSAASTSAQLEASRRRNGQFGVAPAAEAGQVDLAHDDGRIWVDPDGDCDNCGHTQEPGRTCEVCDPSCPECGEPMESTDQSQCDHCQEREDENAWHDDDDDDD